MNVETRDLWLTLEDVKTLLVTGERTVNDSNGEPLIAHLHIIPRDMVAAKELVNP